MGLDFDLINGQTPLDEEEKDGLLISTITNRGELDEFEQQNIEKAIQWTLTRKFKKDEILTEKFVRLVHKKMYGDVLINQILNNKDIETQYFYNNILIS